MNPDYVVGNFRIHFASQKRRRRFVVLVYSAFGLLALACFLDSKQDPLHAWTVAGSMILVVALVVIFTGIVGDIRFQGDQRENYRRDHAHYIAYYRLGSGLVATLICSSIVHSPGITGHLSAAVRGYLEHLPIVMLVGERGFSI